MRPYFRVWRFRSFVPGIRRRKDSRTIAFHNYPGFLGFYGRIPLTRDWMLTAGLSSAD